jgi:hypothetical protein
VHKNKYLRNNFGVNFYTFKTKDIKGYKGNVSIDNIYYLLFIKYPCKFQNYPTKICKNKKNIIIIVLKPNSGVNPGQGPCH